MASKLADLVRRARKLSTERDRMIEAVATEWARALRGQRLSANDLDELWAALTEDALRHAVPGDGKWSAQAWRQETGEVIARVREKVEATLREH
jgi:ketosteroid isomerase-like protein